MDDIHALAVQTPSPSVRTPTLARSDSPSGPREPGFGVDSPFPEPVPVRVHSVRGGGDVRLSVYDAGDLYGPALVFIHGFSQCHMAWRRQFQSALSLGFRVVALDLRGHGQSDKPRAAYGDGRLWAQDLHAVLSTLGLERPLLVGWSYGGIVISDYLRHYGQAHLAGIHFVSAITNSGSEEAFSVLAPEMLSLIPGLFSQDELVCQPHLERFVSLLHHVPVPEVTRELVLDYTRRVPSHVREALGSRAVDNDDVLHRLTLPVLISHGLEDRVVLPESSRHIASVVPDAQVSLYPGIGHSPFWEDSRRFNRELAAFAARCW
jgi:pimeloyl-ACP methyl ester carboxylesterase